MTFQPRRVQLLRTLRWDVDGHATDLNANDTQEPGASLPVPDEGSHNGSALPVPEEGFHNDDDEDDFDSDEDVALVEGSYNDDGRTTSGENDNNEDIALVEGSYNDNEHEIYAESLRGDDAIDDDIHMPDESIVYEDLPLDTERLTESMEGSNNDSDPIGMNVTTPADQQVEYQESERDGDDDDDEDDSLFIVCEHKETQQC